VKWPWSRREEPKNVALSIADPTLAALFTPGGLVDLSGVSVNETSALGISALYRGLSLVSGTLASLPLNSWRATTGDQREKVPSVFDDPDGPDGQTVFEWKETAFLHLMLHGRAGALKVRNEAGGLVRLALCHPLSFQVVQPSLDEQRDPAKMPVGGVWFDITLDSAKQIRRDAKDFWYVPAASMGGQVGISLLTYARQSLATGIAGEKAAGKVFSSGALLSGLATPMEDGELEDVEKIRAELNRNVLGHENAGTIALVNRRLQFTPWTMTAQQAQFLESRQFQIEEIARWTGVPPHLLMQTDKQTSWGTGVDEQNRGLSKFVLGHWANRFEQRASRLLARPRWCEFDFAGLERPNYAVEAEIDLKEVSAGVMTADEYRAKRGRPPLPQPEAMPVPDDGADGDSATE
jgi:HK97 family phage portal protein